MTRPRRLAAVLAVAIGTGLGFAGPAAAHRMKMFVTAVDGEISGYAFFVGGGRPTDVDVVVADTAGAEVFRGRTDDQGGFRWRPPKPADYTVTVDAGDGHWTAGTIAADRLGAASPLAPAPSASVAAAPVAAPAAPAAPAGVCPAAIDPAALAAMVEAQVDRAVARQVRPLIEATERAEGRVRFNDVMGGLGMIVGLAGAAMWATTRRRGREGGTTA